MKTAPSGAVIDLQSNDVAEAALLGDYPVRCADQYHVRATVGK
ncbi:hypothetical protein DEU50_101582 [Aeromonas salmonicida]|uniref:Uncharacterized protein n=1 Tax=Aeromonas salmonicida TaxID=645 RepID=A0AAX1PNP2_AERSA|nr:hypothetical protein DEU50_101582 [Aeromonas salmonicida]